MIRLIASLKKTNHKYFSVTQEITNTPFVKPPLELSRGASTGEPQSLTHAAAHDIHRQQHMKAILFNAQGLVGPNSVLSQAKFLEVQALGAEASIMAIVETWLEEAPTPDATVSIPDFTLFRCDRLDRNHSRVNGGGVALYIRNTLKAIEISRYNNRECEAIATKFHKNTSEFIVIAAYNPPASCTHEISTKSLLKWITDTLKDHNAYTVLFLGDINMPDIDWDIMQCTKESTTAPEHTLIELCDTHNLTQHNRQPSRPNNQNILDLVLCKPEHIVQEVRQLPLVARSDHFPLEITLTLETSTPLTTQPKPLNYWKADYESMNIAISSFTEELRLCNPLEADSLLYDRLNEAIRNTVPPGRHRQSKYSKKYRKLRNEKNKLIVQIKHSKYPRTIMLKRIMERKIKQMRV